MNTRNLRFMRSDRSGVRWVVAHDLKYKIGINPEYVIRTGGWFTLIFGPTMWED